MTELANFLLRIRYIFYVVIFALSVVIVALTVKIVQMTYEMFLTIIQLNSKKLIHEALEIADVALVIVLLGVLSNYLLFKWVITEDKADKMPNWAVKQSKEHDIHGLKSSIGITVGAIFLIYLLGEVIDPNLATDVRAAGGWGAEWYQLALYTLLIISVLILTVSAWIARKD